MQNMTSQFGNWLIKQDPTIEVDPTDITGCFGFRFLKDHGYPVLRVGVFDWFDQRGHGHIFSREIGDFIEKSIMKGARCFGDAQKIWGRMERPSLISRILSYFGR